MIAQKDELEILSFGRPIGTPYGGRRSGTLKARRRKRRLRKRIRRICLACCAVAFIGVWMEQTDWIDGQTEWRSGRAVKEEKAKAERVAKQADCPKELAELLEQNEETCDFVENYPNRDAYIDQEIDLSGDVQAGRVPLLMQWDKRWGYDLYGESMIGLSGCGPTCMTMAYLYFTNDLEMNPRKMACFAQENGFHSSEGTSWDFWTLGAQSLGLMGENISLSEGAMKNALDGGGLLVCSMSPGDFTTTGHFILVRGYDENGFFVNDPNRVGNSKLQWGYEALCPQIKNLWAIYPM